MNWLRISTIKILYIDLGANMVKWTKKLLRYAKNIIILVKCLQVVAKHCLNWYFFHNDLCCCVKYSNVEYRVEISVLIITSDAQKQMVKSNFRHGFDDLNYFKMRFFFHVPWIPNLFKGIITKNCRKKISF